MIALNRNEIRNKSVRFWTLFGLLLMSTLIVVYFFVWSSHKESEDYIAKIQENRSALNKQIALKTKVDSLYNLMSYLEYGSVDNYMFLKSYIRDQKISIRQLIGTDSNTRFSAYSKVVDQLEPQIALRDTIIGLTGTAEELRSNLERCKTRNKSIGKSLIRGSRQ